nr:tRNA-dihydrouridine synthase C [Klebsiella pneumoniae]
MGVDLNCGCPSKLVNGSGGGATLLKDPELIYRGAKAMREAVPEHLPVTVKVRLGWDSGERRFEIADAVQQAGPANWWFTAVPKKMATKPNASTGRRSARSASA